MSATQAPGLSAAPGALRPEPSRGLLPCHPGGPDHEQDHSHQKSGPQRGRADLPLEIVSKSGLSPLDGSGPTARSCFIQVSVQRAPPQRGDDTLSPPAPHPLTLPYSSPGSLPRLNLSICHVCLSAPFSSHLCQGGSTPCCSSNAHERIKYRVRVRRTPPGSSWGHCFLEHLSGRLPYH